MNRSRLESWGGAFFALIGLAGCGGVSVGDGSGTGGSGSSGGTGGGGSGGSGAGGTGAIAGGGTGGTVSIPERRGACTDSNECSPGRECVAFTDGIGCQSGHVCETSLDECDSNADCTTGLACLPDATSVRRCSRINCVEGRPFLIDGEARTAAPSERADWLAREALAAAHPIDGRLRAALHEHWLLAARMEHASVAAFARFSLELLALGAPSDLVLESARAMQDETIHAELCFGLASRFGEAAVGPGPLDVDRALDDVTLDSAVKNTLLEGCIGETLAAAEAQAACEHARDPVVRAILERIAADETRHAALAFRFVTWALGRGDPRIAELVRRTLDAPVQIAIETNAAAAPESALLHAGVLPAQHRAQVRRYAYENIVLRALRALLHEPEATTRPVVASC